MKCTNCGSGMIVEKQGVRECLNCGATTISEEAMLRLKTDNLELVAKLEEYEKNERQAAAPVGMTIKQIAELCGVEDRTVRNWVHQAAENNTAMAEKMSASTSTYPACFTLPETLAIIRAGGKNTLADLLETNAASAGTAKVSDGSVAVDYKELAAVVAHAVAAAMAPLIRELRQAPATRQGQLALPAATANEDYYSIKAYANIRGMRVNKNTAVAFGREASRLSRERNVEIRKVADAQWGEINSYHISILKEIFTL